MKKSLLLLMILAAIFLRACAAPAGTIAPVFQPRLATASPSVTPSPSPSPTLDDASFWATWVASRPRNMEAYGMVFDPAATPRLPPFSSVDMPIWDQRLPLQVLDHTPRFVRTLPLRSPPDLSPALVRAGCSEQYGQLQCSSDSPLMDFGCEWLSLPDGTYPSLPDNQQVIAICLKTPVDENENRDNYLYRTGCAFRRDAGLIIDENGVYSILTTPAQVKDFLLPIDSPEKALTAFEMLTGLSATYAFEADTMLLYFMDPLEGTRIVEQNGGYRVNLFLYAHCLCEPWVNSMVELQMDRQANITWLNALPISMTVGFSCAD